MSEDIILLDPSPERAPAVRARRARPASIAGAQLPWTAASRQKRRLASG